MYIHAMLRRDEEAIRDRVHSTEMRQVQGPRIKMRDTQQSGSGGVSENEISRIGKIELGRKGNIC